MEDFPIHLTLNEHNLDGFANRLYKLNVTGGTEYSFDLQPGTTHVYLYVRNGYKPELSTRSFYLDNVEVSFPDANGSTDTSVANASIELEVLETKDYYPFGARIREADGSVVIGKVHPYGFNGKEENYDFQNSVSTLDFGARLYDPAIGRWGVIDPLADLMRRHSPYNYAFNKPLRFIDPDGMSPNDVIIEGSEEFRKEAFANLQALTDDTLEINKNGEVTIAKTNCSEGCEKGDNLVSDLINSDKVVTIKESGSRNATEAADNNAAGDNTASDSTVSFNPNRTEGGVDENGSKSRPSEIGLAHELGHARNIANGTKPTINLNSQYVEPYEDLGFENQDPNLFITIPQREAIIRSNVENPIRVERGLPKRRLVPSKDFKHHGKF